ncbi:hypothetical protein BC941DRAFT_421838 [Chlamydoabsidia padenii]|nr:hypothetical protein BC941DRAFT_421838 [Chlamydoabsidia padenii]
MFAGQRPQPLSLQQRVYTMGKDLWPEPTSPAATTITTFSSLSWAAEKSAAELRIHLKNAHISLREKEKDLKLAAEIGHYLLENNAALKSQYETLLQQQLLEQQDDQDTEDNDDCDFILVSQQKAHQRVLGELQDKNMELQRLLEDAQDQTDKVKMVHDKKARELEYDITLLKDHLDMAAQRIEEMEQDGVSALVNNNGGNSHQVEYQQRQQEHDGLLVELQHKIDQLEYENNQLIHNRQTIQDRLDKALHDVDALQTQFNIGEWTREGYAQLNDAYQRQFSHIAQLSMSLEEHRHILTHLVENDGLPAFSHSISSAATTHNSDTCYHNSNNNNNSLMVELEKAWHRDHSASNATQQQTWRFYDDQQQQQQQDKDDGYSSLSGSGAVKCQDSFSGFTDTSCFYAPPRLTKPHLLDNNTLDYALIKYDNNNDDDDNLFGPLDSNDALTTYNLYPDLSRHTYSTGLIMSKQEQQQQQQPVGMVNKVQRWCRFAIVLTVAVFINVFEGPDIMLEDKQ